MPRNTVASPGTLGVAAFLLPLVLGAAPCKDDPRHAEMSAWIGEWRVVSEIDGESREVATTTVRWILNGCAVEEVRTLADGREERGLMVLDSANGLWRQTWASNRGDTGELTLEVSGERTLAEGVARSLSGDELVMRATISSMPDGTFLEEGEFSDDGWASSQTMPRTRYVPLSMAASLDPPEPATPTETTVAESPRPLQTAPAPEAAAEPRVPIQPPGDDVAAPAPAAGAVRVRSERKRQQRQTAIEMQSPMTLEFELGPVHLLPPGSAWRTSELEVYTAEQVSVAQVSAERRRKRGRHQLILTVNLRTSAFQRKAGVEARLLSGGSEVAAASEGRIAIGKMIGAHDPESGRPVELLFDLDQGQLEELFEDERPSIELTVSVE